MGIKSSHPHLAHCRYCHRKDLKAFGARSPEKLAQMRRLLAEARKHPVKRSVGRAQQLSEAERRDLAEFPVDMSYGGSLTTDATQRVEDYASARAQQLSEAAQQLESGFVGALAAVTGIPAAELRRLGF